MMRRLILKMSISLDGFVAGPNGESDWMHRSRDDGGRSWVEDTLWQAGLHVMGRRTYHDMALSFPAERSEGKGTQDRPAPMVGRRFRRGG
jgi:dihydrofolate reductase